MNETIEQLKRLLREMWHRRWIGLAAAWIAALVGVAVVYRIPERYEATARVFVDTETLLKPLLAGLATPPNIDQQVAYVSRTLISRPNVEKVVRMADMDIVVRDEQDRQALIDSMLATIKLTVGANANLYLISYRDRDPESARKVVQSLLTIFMESSLTDKRQDTRAAVRFLDEQIRQYELALQAAEARLKEFRLKYMNVSRNAGAGDYFGRIGQLRTDIEAAKLDLSVVQRQRESYKKELSGEQPVFLNEAADPIPDSVPDIDMRLNALRRDLDELRRKYTDAHPDVAGTRNIIEQLEQQRATELESRRKAASASSKNAKSTDRNPVFQQLRISLAESEAAVASAQAKLAGYEQQLNQLVSQAKLVPQVEAELAQLNRDYDVQKKTYESLLSRRESATMGIGVQDTTSAVQFRVIDPPRVSPNPVAPTRLMLLGLAFLASLGIGVLAAFVVSKIAPTFHDGRSLREATNRPVLGSVSMLPSPAVTRTRRRRAWVFAGGVSGLFAFFAGVTAFALLLWRAAV